MPGAADPAPRCVSAWLCPFPLRRRRSDSRPGKIHHLRTGPGLQCASEQFRGRLDREFPPSVRDTVLLERDADRARERCEDIIITSRRPELDAAPPAAGP